MGVINAGMAATLEVVSIILNFYIWLLIVGAAISWLVAFGVVNQYNRFVQVVGDFVNRLTEPLLRPIRKVIPPVGGLDLSPLVLILLIIFIHSFIFHLLTGL